MTYAPDGQVASTRDPLGRVVRRFFDDLGNISGLELPGGTRWAFLHDPLSRLREATDPEGGTWRWDYGANGQPTSVVDPTGVRQELSQEYLSALPAASHSVGGTGEEAASQPGAWRQYADRRAALPSGRADTGGLAVSVDSGAGATTQLLDELGRPAGTEDPDGSMEVVVRDRCGRVVEYLDADGALTRLERDAAGRVVEHVTPTGASTHYAYDACGRLIRVTGPGGEETTLVWDADSRLVEHHLPTGEVERVVYDAVGRVVRYAVPGEGVWRATYDRCGRVTALSDPAHGPRRFRYDAAGQLVEAVSALGGVTRYDYDEAGRCTAVTDPLGGVTRFRFNARNQVVALTDPLGRTTTAGYDAAGRQLWQRDPDGRTTSWAYDEAGRQHQVSVDGQLLATVERDHATRSVRITEAVPDSAGAAAASTGSAGDPPVSGRQVEHVVTFDRCGRLVSRLRGGRGMSFTYDAEGRRTSMVDARGSRTRYVRDASGRVTRVEGPAGSAQMDYDASGRLVAARTASMVQEWVWTSGFLAQHTVRRTSGPGNGRTGETGETVSRTVLTRDDQGRLLIVDGPEGRTELTYDAAGQLTGALTHQGRKAGQPGAGQERRWAYDLAGRLVSVVTENGSQELTYDAAGQLVAQAGPGDIRIRHSYDGAGRRVGTSGSGPDGRSWRTSYQWGPLGYLSAVEHSYQDPGGRAATRQGLWVDALGEAAAVTTQTTGAAALGEPTTSATSRALLPRSGCWPALPAGGVVGLRLARAVLERAGGDLLRGGSWGPERLTGLRVVGAVLEAGPCHCCR